MKPFIANIDETHTVIRQLETKLGLPHGPFIENIDDANIRIEQLEDRYQNKFGKPPVRSVLSSVGPTTAEQKPTARLVGIDRALAANQGIKTHIEPPKTKLFGLARALASLARR